MSIKKYTHYLTHLGGLLKFNLLALPLVILSLTPATVVAATGSSAQQQYFAEAAREFGVPEKLLLALSYNEARWQAPVGQMSMDGGYGNMDLRDHISQPVDGRGTGVPQQHDTHPADYYTLPLAANLLHTSTNALKMSDQDNIRGGAAVLASFATQLHGGTLPASLDDWYGAVAKYSGSSDVQTAQMFADDVFATLRQGASINAAGGQSLTLPATPDAQPQHTQLQTMGLKLAPNNLNNQGAECPVTLNCRFISAAYAQNSSDPADYGSFDYANRPADMQIKYIVIHDTEGSYDSAIAHFQDPTAYVSGHYIIRSSDGAITQMVHNKDVSWGAGDWYVNMHAINIEHEGFAAQGASWYTEAMYRSSATLVRWLAAKYHIPLDRQHIIGHDNVPRPAPGLVASQHWDPGPYWDWNHYMDLLHNGKASDDWSPNPKVGQTVIISPTFATNSQPLQDCSSGTCVPLPPQGSSIVYLHTQPSAISPLLSDPYLHPDNSPGTTNVSDWSATASSGEEFVVAGVQGDWTGVYFGGKVGWFYNPASARTAHRVWSATLKPRTGLNSLPVYGVAYPEASAYPADVPFQNINQLYSIPAGQVYATSGPVPDDYFYDATIDYSLPDDHIIVQGNQKYYQISFNHRFAYVKANDVEVHYR